MAKPPSDEPPPAFDAPGAPTRAGSAEFSVPHLRTERLLLRELRVADFDDYARFSADPEATRFLSGVVDRRIAWRHFASLSGAWMLTDAGWWAIELAATGAFIGTVGAFFRETALPVGPDSDIEIGWTILPAYWRKGYATEAARAALDYALSRHDVPRAIAQMDPAHVASIRVAKAIGMSFDGEADFYGEPGVRYAIARSAPRRS